MSDAFDDVEIQDPADATVDVSSPDEGTVEVLEDSIDVLDLQDVDLAALDVQDVPDAVVELPDTPNAIVEVYGSYVGTGALIPGPQGQSGLDGRDGTNGQPRYQGLGPPPDFIVGSNPGDLYLDRLTGDLYQLT